MARCPVLPLALRVGELWDAYAAAQEREFESGGDSIVSDQVDAMRIRAQEIAGASRARSLAGVLFQVALAADAAARLRDEGHGWGGHNERVDVVHRELEGILNSVASALRDKLGPDYEPVRSVVSTYLNIDEGDERRATAKQGSA
jgi:hypothetical protein